eukprot:Gregarina_sp_Poly_1__11186@NODE_913_length_5727_cov_62_297527_g650_i0_p4_GENE_NODE_913_length_5727_cov_62_297527_g650_i0NODE_913_length_5727_cov_62_297527_g650_i0_p4_ORF_typecomplete_len164_score6_96CRCB/PF02537_15/4_6e05_NODE_913_length_5727_cov_62_297527_g650_i028913382
MGAVQSWPAKGLHFVQLGITVGFCGSLTTWSSLVTTLRMDVIKHEESPTLWLLKMFVNLCIYYIMYRLGTHFTHLIYQIDSVYEFWDDGQRNTNPTDLIEDDESNDLDLNNFFDGKSALKISNRNEKTNLWIMLSCTLAAYCGIIVVTAVNSPISVTVDKSVE